jgi:DNA ligase D-like protein (predicted 3'-phosphoesterase)
VTTRGQQAWRQPERSLQEYREKRDFSRTAEPPPSPRDARTGPLLFCVQKHAARRLHYDFRLEVDGVLKSWPIPKGPSYDPAERRLAVMTEDHPLDYASFEGVIPKGEYGAGRVIVWDRGTYANETDHDMADALQRGHLSFRLDGEKLHGGYALTRMRKGKDEAWLLVKRKDEDADARRKPIRSQPESVLSGRTLDELS